MLSPFEVQTIRVRVHSDLSPILGSVGESKYDLLSRCITILGYIKISHLWFSSIIVEVRQMLYLKGVNQAHLWLEPVKKCGMFSLGKLRIRT